MLKGSKGNKYLVPVSTNKIKDTLKEYEEPWNEIRDLIRSTTNNFDNDNEKCMKI